ncbi:MAG: hypothetical protein CMI57_00590 [Parcubacteria group bacterium]|nr:hypothetical protein [Parcubacteria group bacterium]
METKDIRSTILEVGDRIIFHEEGTVSFHNQHGKTIRLGFFQSDKYFFDQVTTRSESLCTRIAELIARSHGFKSATIVEGRPGHLTFEFV